MSHQHPEQSPNNQYPDRPWQQEPTQPLPQGYQGQQPIQQQPNQPGYPNQGANPTADAPKAGGLGATFDFTFRRYATPTIAKIVYILVIAFALLNWLGTAIMFFIAGAAGSSSYGSNPTAAFSGFGVVWLLFGWIPALLEVIFVRIFMELAIANIRTAEDVDALRHKLGAA